MQTPGPIAATPLIKLMGTARIPRAPYRFQFNPAFPFAEAAALGRDPTDGLAHRWNHRL